MHNNSQQKLDAKGGDVKGDAKTNAKADAAGFSERMRALMATQKSVNSFAKTAGVTEGAIRNYLRGGVKPSQKVLEAIARTAGVSVIWLATGEGEQTPAAGELLFGTPSEREVMKLAIKDAEEILNVLKTDITPDQKADLMLTLYDYYAASRDAGTDISADNVISFIQEKLKKGATHEHTG